LNWTEAIEIAVQQEGHERYRWLCSDDNPDVRQREAYRALMVRKATGQPEPSSSNDAALRAYVAAHGCGGC
jgi:hypothetical protein